MSGLLGQRTSWIVGGLAGGRRSLATARPHRRAGSPPSLWQRTFQGRDQVQRDAHLEDEFEMQEAYQREIESEQRRARLQRLRNKSGLSASHRRMLHGHAPLRGVAHVYDDEERSARYQLGVFGRFGAAETAWQPGLAWPNPAQLAAAREYEHVLYAGQTLADLVQGERAAQAAAEAAILQREKEIDEKFEVMDKQIKNLDNKLVERERTAEREKEKRNMILAELRQEYGYDIDPQMPQFAEEYQNRERALLKREKEDRKQDKAKKAIVRSERMASENSPDSSS